MTPNSLESQLVIGAILFALGMIGFLTRRNLILIVLSTELMLHGVSLNLTAFGKYHGNPQGQVLTLYQRRKSLDVFLWGNLGEEDLPILSGPTTPAPTRVADPNADLPHLTPAGRAPTVPATKT
jgi:NADH-quinone oxidoreductase subunit K